MTDGTLGTLAWNRELGWWSGSAEIEPDRLVDLYVQAANDVAALSNTVRRIAPSWERLTSREPTIRDAVAAQLVEARNEYCDPEDEVTPEQFASRLRLKSVLFEDAGTIELVYDDGFLFGGHDILVPIGADGSVGEASES